MAVADGERMVFVGFVPEVFRDEFVAGDAEHGVEDARVGDAASAELGVEHLLVGLRHWSVVTIDPLFIFCGGGRGGRS